MKFYHNPRCRKSRETLKIVEDSGIQPEVIEYLKTPPSESELKDILKKLGMKPEELIRKGEEIYKQKFKGKSFSDDEWIKLMVENPVLIERPIVVKDNKAALGRPPENVKKLL